MRYLFVTCLTRVFPLKKKKKGNAASGGLVFRNGRANFLFIPEPGSALCESRPGEKVRQLTSAQCVFPLLLRTALDASKVMVHRENRSVMMQIIRFETTAF